MNEQAQWWYERNGSHAGPVPLDTLQRMAGSGELKPATLVWTAGMAGWARADTVSSLAWPATPPPIAPPEPAAPPPPSENGASTADPFARDVERRAPAATQPVWTTTAVAAPSQSPAQALVEPERISILSTILLSIVTLTIYGAIKFYKTGLAYDRLAGVESKFKLYFWLYVGLTVAGVLLSPAGPLGLLGFAGLVFAFLALKEALDQRNAGLRRHQMVVEVASDTTHYLFYALGVFLMFFGVGLIFLAIQAVKWFEDWNAVRDRALGAGPAA